MTHIVGFINTTSHDEDMWYTTAFHWSPPEPGDDVERFVRIAAKRFAEELRRTIQT